MNERIATRALRLTGRGGRPARFLAPFVAMWGMVGAGDSRRIRTQLTGSEQAVEDARADVYRRLWLDAAARAGAEVTESVSGFMSIRCDDAVTVVRENLVELDSPVTLALAGDRVASAARLSEAGLPTTDQESFTLADPAPAFRFLRRHGACVVKPAYGTGAGAGVTCDVRTVGELARAALAAVRYCPELVIERQLSGNEHRLLVLDGEVIGSVRRRRPSVTGDGRSTVAELIAAENRRRLAAEGREGLLLLGLTFDACLALDRQGLTPASVPVKDATVVVAGAVNAGSAAECESEHPHPELAAHAVAAVRALGLRLASVELSVQFPSAGGDPVVSGIIEVNSTPGLTYHYLVRDSSTARPVAEDILATLLAGSNAAPPATRDHRLPVPMPAT
ncbi:hypothetical protein [Blastococcus sp. SYSU DS0616]